MENRLKLNIQYFDTPSKYGYFYVGSTLDQQIDLKSWGSQYTFYTLMNPPTDPVVSGMTFVGWRYRADGEIYTSQELEWKDLGTEYVDHYFDAMFEYNTLKINGQSVSEMKINGSIVKEAKINGQIVYGPGPL